MIYGWAFKLIWTRPIFCFGSWINLFWNRKGEKENHEHILTVFLIGLSSGLCLAWFYFFSILSRNIWFGSKYEFVIVCFGFAFGMTCMTNHKKKNISFCASVHYNIRGDNLFHTSWWLTTLSWCFCSSILESLKTHSDLFTLHISSPLSFSYFTVVFFFL